MEKKNIIKIVIITIVCTLLLESLIYLAVKSFSKINKNSDLGVNSIKETKFDDIPSFNLSTSGAYKFAWNEDSLKDLTKYEFKATIQTGENKKQSTYVGVRVIDLLNKYNANDFISIQFNSAIGTVTIDKKDLTKDEYFVFKIDGENLTSGDMLTLISADKSGQYSIPFIGSLIFTIDE
jgi:hypothetical protein